MLHDCWNVKREIPNTVLWYRIPSCKTIKEEVKPVKKNAVSHARQIKANECTRKTIQPFTQGHLVSQFTTNNAPFIILQLIIRTH